MKQNRNLLRRLRRRVALFLAGACVLLLGSCAPSSAAEDPSVGSGTAPPAPQTASDLRLNEYMAHNTYTVYAPDGGYYDWLELYNAGKSDVALDQYCLTDNDKKPTKWQFPAGTVIRAGEYLLVWCSGKTDAPAGELHTSFKLGDDDTVVALFTAESVLADALPVVKLEENISYGRAAEDPQALRYFTMPTPGKANTGPSFETLAATHSLAARTVYISEVSAAYALGNKTKEQHDWIELHNRSAEPVDLTGYGLCKKLDGPRYIFGQQTLAADGYCVIEALGRDMDADSAQDTDGEPISGLISGGYRRPEDIDDDDDDDDDDAPVAAPTARDGAPFQVDTSGDTLYLVDRKGRVVDVFETGKLRIGETSGRAESLERVWFANPTPGKANAAPLRGIAPQPTLSPAGGYAKPGTAVTVSAPQGVTLRYTSDGSVPTEQSPKVGGPLRLQETVTLRVRAFADGLLPSDTATESYLLDLEHKIPVIFLSSDPDGLTGYQNGILADGPGYGGEFPYEGANFWKDWERAATLEYYSPAGVKQTEFHCGIAVHGQYTRAYDQKSLALHLRDSYGMHTVTYPFFPGNKYTTNTDFVLRAAGQDQYNAKIRDAFCSEVVKGYTRQVFMDWQPVALYLNGKYWGLFDWREKINSSYLAEREGLDKDHMDIIKGDSIVLAGNRMGFREMILYAQNHDLRQKAAYDHMASLMDIDNYIDYLISTIFFYNEDSGNIKCYRERPEGANGGSKWRWEMYDFDAAMYSDAIYTSMNSIQYMFNPDGHGSGHMFSTLLQRSLMRNDDFRAKFRARYYELLDTAFTTEHMREVLDRMTALMRPEITNNAGRWEAPSVTRWENSIADLYRVIEGRPALARKQLDAFLAKY
ncbi:MAG: CotH kinase family protein [Oscillospiraceae bacterium]|jgi:hypothetical protein|nr:CotH kinase family protein [Oscillospiraceae bacterium]